MHRYARPLSLAVPMLFLGFVLQQGMETFWNESAACVILSPLIYTRFLPLPLKHHILPFLCRSPFTCYLITLAPIVLFAASIGLAVRGWRHRQISAATLGLMIMSLLLGVYVVLKPMGMLMA